MPVQLRIQFGGAGRRPQAVGAAGPLQRRCAGVPSYKLVAVAAACFRSQLSLRGGVQRARSELAGEGVACAVARVSCHENLIALWTRAYRFIGPLPALATQGDGPPPPQPERLSWNEQSNSNVLIFCSFPSHSLLIAIFNQSGGRCWEEGGVI